MRKYLAMLMATMLCVCCLGLAACGDSGSSSSASSSAAESASSSEATESSAAEAADPSEKFVGDWKLAGLETQGVIVIGDLETLGVGSASLSIAAEGTGTIDLDGDSTPFTWEQADENTLTVTVKNTTDETPISATASATYENDTVRMTIKTEEQEGTIIFSKDGTIAGMTALTMDDATDITSEDELIGTWKINALTYEGASMYGDSENLAAINGSEEMVLVFEEGGKATMLGSEAAWSIDENGAVVTDEGSSVTVKALGDDIILNIGEPYGIEMFMRFSK